ncbi:MAG: hypothetical protein AAFR75_12735 [Pseudomonadota bacterium]
MISQSTKRSATTTPAALATPILLLILLGGCLNGFAVRISEAVNVQGMATVFLGISPFDLIVLFAAVTLIWENRPTTEQAGSHVTIGAPEVIAIAALMIPSSATSWLVVALYATYQYTRLADDRRTGLLFFAGLAMTSLWSSVVMKIIGTPVTSVEAAIVALVLSTFTDGVVQSGNVVGNPDVFSLIVLTACSTLDTLPKALLGLAAVMWLSDTLQQRSYIASAIMLAALYVVANLARLTIMAMSNDLYDLAHGPIGAGIFDGIIVASVFALSLCWTAPYAKAEQAT